MRTRGRIIALLTLLALFSGQGVALAVPPPTPPPNPSDQQLRDSGGAVVQQAGIVGQLTGQLSDLDQQADDLQADLAGQRETAEGALVDLQNAQDAAEQAKEAADAARVATEAASAAIDDAQARLDAFLTSTYQQGLDDGPLGLLSQATTPDELVARAQFQDLIATSQQGAVDGLERARTEKANADSSARAALDDAQAKQAAATAAKGAADAAVAAAEQAARVQAQKLAAVAAQKAQVQARLDALTAADAGLRAQRDRYDQWQAAQAAAAAAQARAAQSAAAARVAVDDRGPVVRGGSGAVQRVIDRAMSVLGTQYVWGGGSPRGPTTGIPDGLGSPLNRIGFDCSGLMLYAFAAAGVTLPRVSRNQFNAGTKVPISQVRPGDLVFYGDPIHHVAMYIGGGKMIEAPYTGANVRVVPMRYGGLVDYATRIL